LKKHPKKRNKKTQYYVDISVKTDDSVKNDKSVEVDATVRVERNEMHMTASTDSGKNPSRQKRRYGRTRRQILEAARAVFAERGLAAATVEEIADRADVGRGSVYYHFENKDDLISELMTALLTDLSNQMKRQCSGKEELYSMLEAIITAHIEFFSRRWEDFVLYYQGRADLTLNESYGGLETPFLKYISCIEQLVDEVISPPISKPRLRRLACAVAGFISGYYSIASVSSVDDDVDRSFMSLRDAFVVALARFIREALPDPKDIN